MMTTVTRTGDDVESTCVHDLVNRTRGSAHRQPAHTAGRPSRARASAGLAACRPNSAQASVTRETSSALLLANRFRSILMLSCEAGKVITAMGGGRTVHIASVSSQVADPDYAAYATGKAGQSQLVRVLAREWALRFGAGAALTGFTAAVL